MSIKKIETLADDIMELLSKEEHHVTEDRKKEFAEDLVKVVIGNIWNKQRGPVLRMSALGNKCDRQMWIKDRFPGEEEKLPPQSKLKYLYGHILEHLLLFLAKESGHDVVGEQDEFEIDGVLGHRDAVIDGVTTDVKSASTFGYEKFRNHKLETDDPFGYMGQIFGYVYSDKKLKDDRGAFLAIDKQFGHVCVDIYPNNGIDYKDLVKKKKRMLLSEEPPKRSFMPIPDGKSGNMKLGVECSYCPVKKKCWPGLRTFVYSSGLRFLTHVERLPDVKEV